MATLRANQEWLCEFGGLNSLTLQRANFFYDRMIIGRMIQKLSWLSGIILLIELGITYTTWVRLSEAVLKVSRPAGIKGTNPGDPGTKNE
jgi:hypothetical protein